MKFSIKTGGKEYFIKKGSLIIGRGDNADITVSSKKLSRLHARFSIQNNVLKVEDLESKNGTFVDKKRVTRPVELRPGDEVRCGNIFCTIAAADEGKEEDAASAVNESETKEAITPEEQKRRKRLRILTNAAALIIIAGAISALVLMLTDEQPGAAKAQQTLEQAREVLREITPLVHLSIPGKLIRGIQRIDTTVTSLEKISRAFEYEYDQARGLISRLEKAKENIADRIIRLQSKESLKNRYDRIIEELRKGTISDSDAVRQLQYLAKEMEGTIYEKIYKHKAERLKKQIVEDTKIRLRKRIEEAELLCCEERFGDAVRLLAKDPGNPYTENYRKETIALKNAEQTVMKRFKNAMHNRERGWIADAELGRCDAAEEKVRKAFAAWNVPGSEKEKQRICAKIDSVRTRLLQESAENIKEDMDEARASLNAKHYTKAARTFSDLLKVVGNSDLRKYIEDNRKKALLLEDVKTRLISALNRKRVSFSLIAGSEGEIVKADKEKFYLKMQNDTVGFAWGVLQDYEFARLIISVAGHEPEALLGAGIMLNMLDSRLGSREIYKAAELKQALRDTYAWAYADLSPSFNEEDIKAAVQDIRWKDTPVIYNNKRASNPGKAVPGEPTCRSLGIRWNVRGDRNRNALVTLEFREQGSQAWLRGMNPVDLTDVAGKDDSGKITVYAGSVFDLKPGTAYELRLRLRDPDGGRAERRIASQTCAEPVPWSKGRMRHVVPAGNPSTEFGDTFEGFEFAQLAARPGDTILIQEGTYSALTVTRSGKPGRPVVYRGAVEGKVIVDGEGCRAAIQAKNVSYIIFENLTVRNAGIGLDLNGSSDIAVKGCYFSGCSCCVSAQVHGESVMSRFWISDNTFRGPVTWPENGKSGAVRAVQISGRGHTVSYNRIIGWEEGISVFPSSPVSCIDICNNDISGCTGDGIAADFSECNVRIFRNRIVNCGNGISLQSVWGGPVYIFRNVMYNIREQPFKAYRALSGVIFLHNTCVRKGSPLIIRGGPLNNMIFKNNLFAGTACAFAIDSAKIFEHCYLDYNTYSGEWNTFARFGSIQYASIVRFRKKEHMELHGKTVKSGTVFQPGIKPPSDIAAVYTAKEAGVNLRSGSPCIDAACRLPNINDGYRGVAPDMGAYERGGGIPHYGPRTR